MSKYGIDVSKYQGTIDWKKVKASGIEFAIMKIIGKSLKPDVQFENNWNGCVAVGMRINGVYDYSYYTNAELARTGAQAVLNVLNGRKTRVYLDVEDDCLKGLGKGLIDIINAYAEVIIGAGLEFGVYTGSYFYTKYIKPYGDLQCPMWIANYGENNGQMNTKPQISGINMVGWQFTSRALVDGINGYVDKNIWYEELENKKEEENAMALTIGHASIDERGKIKGGENGDQTGKEVCTRSYYMHSKGWYLLRPKKVEHANEIAEAMLRACNNNNIGYDQYNRLGVITYGTNSSVKTECDCSSLVRQCVKEGTGVDAGNFTTATEKSMLLATGLFENAISVTSSTILYNGDILVTKTKGHTVIVVSGNPRPTTTTANKPNKVVGSTIIAQGQKHAIEFTGVEIEVDGLVGSETREMKARVLQHGLNLDYGNTIAEDGAFGTKSKGKLGLHYVKRGETQHMVSAAEILMELNGIDPNGVEYPGTYGNGLTNAAKKFFGDNGTKISASKFLKLIK